MFGESFLSIAGYLFLGLWSVFVAAFGLLTFSEDLLHPAPQPAAVETGRAYPLGAHISNDIPHS